MSWCTTVKDLCNAVARCSTVQSVEANRRTKRTHFIRPSRGLSKHCKYSNLGATRFGLCSGSSKYAWIWCINYRPLHTWEHCQISPSVCKTGTRSVTADVYVVSAKHSWLIVPKQNSKTCIAAMLRQGVQFSMYLIVFSVLRTGRLRLSALKAEDIVFHAHGQSNAWSTYIKAVKTYGVGEGSELWWPLSAWCYLQFHMIALTSGLMPEFTCHECFYAQKKNKRLIPI